MPQMSPCSWMSLILLTNFMLNMSKMNMYFEKKY
uniref:ATP synthase F0 subunit 8 n=1 Tax=Cemus sauteri TaxID=871497 RepID=A0A7S4YYX5_9HEMI|nr:ATP synthase F0 subunit 8 [Cemus sauteri]